MMSKEGFTSTVNFMTPGVVDLALSMAILDIQ